MSVSFELHILSIVIASIVSVLITRFYISKKKASESIDNIGVIVVDHSDESTNIFLEIAKDDVEQWEDGKNYMVRVEVRDYLSQ